MKMPFALLAFLAAALGAAADPAVIAFVPMGATHEYWRAMHSGALKAEAELNASGPSVTLIWKGPLREDDRDGQLQVVENFIGRQVNGIVLAPLDRRALVGVVEEAVGAHIPVVAVDAGVESPLISCLIATDNRQGGRIAGRRLGELLGGKGNVILLRNIVGSASTEAREDGFLEVIRKEFPGIKLISDDQHSGPTHDTAKTAAENLINRFGGQVNGVFAPNESSASGMLLALRDAGLAGGKVKFVGFDSAEILLEGLRAGDIQGLVLQDPFKMGYLGVKTIVSVLRGEKVPAQMDTGAVLVTPETMGDPRNAALMHPPVDK